MQTLIIQTSSSKLNFPSSYARTEKNARNKDLSNKVRALAHEHKEYAIDQV